MPFSPYRIFIAAIFLNVFSRNNFFFTNLLNVVYCDLLRVSSFCKINSSILEKNDNLIRSKFLFIITRWNYSRMEKKERDFNLKYISLSCSD